MYFIAGLPRTGSALLSAILSENPNIVSEGQSGLIELMWQNHLIFKENEVLLGTLENTNKMYLKNKILKEIPKLYYYKEKGKIIFDKNRNWTNPYTLI